MSLAISKFCVVNLTRLHYYKAALVLCITLVSVVYGYGFNPNSVIKIDNKQHALVAEAGGCSYQWFKDGNRLNDETDRVLEVEEGGNYTVEITDETGGLYTPNVTVAISALGAIIRVYTIGDSTVSSYTAGYYPQTGWGQVFGAFFNSANVQVINKAVGGTSSKSFYNNQWPAIRSSLVQGDFVLIQFGINDAKHNPPDPDRDAATGGEFEGYLKKFVDDTKAKGAFPILVSTVRRNAWNADGTPYDAYHAYPGAVRTTAAQLKVPLIDLDTKAKNLITKLGQAYVTRYWYLNYPAGDFPSGAKADNVHFQEMGAIEMARLVAEGIKELTGDVNVSKLIPFLKPLYEIAVSVNPAGSDQLTTRTASYPQGLPVTLRTIAKTGKTFQRWNNAAGTSIATTYLTKVTSGTTATSYTAIYAGATTTCSAGISTSGTTTFCQGGSVTLTASTGASYIWKNGTAQVGTGQTFNATTAGSYTVEVTNATNCKATSAATNVTITASSAWYADTDGDGKGDPAVSQTSCTQPTGYVADKTDLCPEDVNKSLPGNCGCSKTEESCLDCNGTANGKALLDNCDRCVAGTTGKTACNAVGEAETDACAYGGILETSNTGFKGTAYINVPNEVGSSISFSITAANAGTSVLSFRYANGGANDRPAQVNINNVNLAANLSFPVTGAFTTWKTADVSLPLVKGLNTVKLVSVTAEGLPNMDQIGYVSTEITKGTCTITGLEEDMLIQDMTCYPNPFSQGIQVSHKGQFDYTLLNAAGYELEKGRGENEITIGQSLQPGLYLVKIQVGVKSKLIKVAKN